MIFEIFTHDTLPSTMDEAKDFLGQATPPFCIVAKEQNRGYGRMERVWESPRGNLYVTLVLEPQGPVKNWAQLSLVTALAIYEIIRKKVFSAHEITLKWPNDILVEGKKIAGILLETSTENPQVLFIGIGLNVAVAPLVTSTCLQACGSETAVDEVLKMLLRAFTENYNRWAKGPFEKICQAWSTLGPPLESPISFTHNQQIIKGLYQGLDAYGGLKLKTFKGDQVFYSGYML